MKSATEQTARVVANFGARLLVRDQQGELQHCVALKKLGLIVTGDLVDWRREASGAARVTYLHPRSSLLERLDQRGKRKPVAANLTRLIVVGAIKPGVETLLIDQYCAAAELADITPIVVINKSDLLDMHSFPKQQRILKTYQKIGYEVALINTHDRNGILPLLKHLNGRVSMLTGQSGVGKSSIINRIFPDLNVRIGALSEASGSGAHTTTVSNWYDFGHNGALIDSPGVRQFSLEHLSQEELGKGFVEIKEASVRCKFNNCTHLHEPRCEVAHLVQQGLIASDRYKNYKKLMRSSTV